MKEAKMARLSYRLSRAKVRTFSVRRVYEGAVRGSPPEEPSSVTLAPRELQGFQLRYAFWHMVDMELKDGDPLKYRWWSAGAPQTIAPDSSEPAHWTPSLARTLATNDHTYRRIALGFLDGRAEQAFQARDAMLTLEEGDFARTPLHELPDEYLVALERTVEAWREAGYNLGETALELGMSYETLNRRRNEGRRRGCLTT